MQCEFQYTDEPNTYRCRHCGFILRAMIYPPERVHMVCSKSNRIPCQNLGRAIGTEECPSCEGNVRVKIFECSAHQTCTLGKQLQAHKCCKVCSEYQ